MRRSRDRLIRALQYTAGILIFLLVWWGGSYLAGPAVLPSPVQVLAYIVGPGVLGDFIVQVTRTLARGLLGFSVAWVIAIPTGILLGRRVGLERSGFFPLFLLQGAPPLFWITPLVLWLGTDGLVAPAVAFLVSLPLLTVHVLSAVKHIPSYEYDVFTVYAPAASVVARELFLPRLVPALKSNIHLGFLVAIKAAMLAEWFAAQDGFGRRINVFYQFFALKEFIGWALLYLILIGGISAGIRRILDIALPGYYHTMLPREQVTQTPGDDPGTGGPDRATPDGGSRLRGQDGQDTVARLTVRDLAVGFAHVPLFSGFSVALDSTRPVALYGPSGCGKTTLLRTIAGLIEPWAGQATHTGRVGLVFQEDALLPHRDAIGNVLLPCLPGFTNEEMTEARECLELWGLGEYAGHFPHELSGGMRKRLAMARAWMMKPQTLLLDEPFVNLDREARRALWELFFTRVQERPMAVLVVTHYPEELESFGVDLRRWNDCMPTIRR